MKKKKQIKKLKAQVRELQAEVQMLKANVPMPLTIPGVPVVEPHPTWFQPFWQINPQPALPGQPPVVTCDIKPENLAIPRNQFITN